MRETPFFFSGTPGAPSHLFGILHEVADTSARPVVVLCAPFVEEKLWAHRTLVSAARAMAAAGYPVLRFDYAGTGESDGDFAEATLETHLADVRAALAEARSRTGRESAVLVGVRFGAAIAGLAAEADGGVSHLALWAPIMDGGRYMQELLRSNLSTQLAAYKAIRHDRAALVALMESGATVNVDGYELSHAMYTQCSAVGLGGGPRPFAGACLVAQVEPTGAAPLARDLEAVAAAYRAATVVRVAEDPFWKEVPVFCGRADRLTQATLDWLAAA
jgi:exosortase A-associated hydrolase 2